MKRIPLLPNYCKKVGFLILIPSVILGIFKWYLLKDLNWLTFIRYVPYKGSYVDIANTLLILLIIAGGLMAAFAKEKIEDEFIVKLRLSSFQWAILVNYIILFVASTFLYGWDFLGIIAWNMFTPLFIFFIRFNYVLYCTKKKAIND
jgi:hypothetical protein